MSRRAVKISSSLILFGQLRTLQTRGRPLTDRNFPVFWRLSAKMLSMSSESESVLTCLCASASRNWRSEGVLMRFPF